MRDSAPPGPRRRFRIQWTILWALATLLLSIGFTTNFWHAATEGFFERHQRDSQSLVVGRLAKSERDGLFSSAALNGRVAPAPPGINKTRYQYLAYRDGLPFADYRPYLSQPGGQGLLFAVLDKLSPSSNERNFAIFQILTATLSAGAVAAIVVWFRATFGLGVFLFVLLGTLYSQWMTVFGRNLYWVLWAFYLPMIVFCALSWTERPIRKAGCFWAGFWPMLLKGLLTGFEYVTTTLIMMAAPLVFTAVALRWSARAALGRTVAALAGAAIALGATLSLLSIQIGLARGEPLAGLRHIVFALRKRTHGDPAGFANLEVRESLSASVLDVLQTYFDGRMATSRGLVRDLGLPLPVSSVTYQDLVLAAFVCTALLVLMVLVRRSLRDPSSPSNDRDLALIATTWFSLLAPISWFVLFKGRAEIHTHMDHIAWHMPFAFFAIALVAVTGGRLIGETGRLTRRLRSGRAMLVRSEPAG